MIDPSPVPNHRATFCAFGKHNLFGIEQYRKLLHVIYVNINIIYFVIACCSIIDVKNGT